MLPLRRNASGVNINPGKKKSPRRCPNPHRKSNRTKPRKKQSRKSQKKRRRIKAGIQNPYGTANGGARRGKIPKVNEKTKRILYYALGIAAVVAIFKGGQEVVGFLDKTFKGQFKSKMIDKALDIQKRLGIDPNLLITQSAVESNWGRSQLSTDDNNYFGMTAGSWVNKGLPITDYPTTEWVNKPVDQVTYFDTPGDLISKEDAGNNTTKVKVHRYFRHYDTLEASVDDWANLISGLSIYKDAYASAQAGDLNAFAAALQKAGYATDPQYAQTLVDFGAQVEAIV